MVVAWGYLYLTQVWISLSYGNSHNEIQFRYSSLFSRGVKKKAYSIMKNNKYEKYLTNNNKYIVLASIAHIFILLCNFSMTLCLVMEGRCNWISIMCFLLNLGLVLILFVLYRTRIMNIINNNFWRNTR